MFRCVTSEGTTGVGRGVLMAARVAGLKTGGLLRPNLRTDTPGCWWLASEYGFGEADTAYRSEVIRMLAGRADAVVVAAEVGEPMLRSHGEHAAFVRAAELAKKPLFVLTDMTTLARKIEFDQASPLADWIMDGGYEEVLFLGDREANNKGIQHRSYRFFRSVFERISRVQLSDRVDAMEIYHYARSDP